MKSLLLFLSLVFTVPALAQIPISVSVKTSSYQVPARKWAKVYVEVQNGGEFYIDGVKAMDTDAIIGFGNSVGNSTSNAISVPADYYAQGTLMCGTASHCYLQNQSWGGLAAGQWVSYNLGPGYTAGFISTGGAKTHVGYARPGNASNRSNTFNLPGGTTISGSGQWTATVELYER